MIIFSFRLKPLARVFCTKGYWLFTRLVSEARNSPEFIVISSRMEPESMRSLSLINNRVGFRRESSNSIVCFINWIRLQRGKYRSVGKMGRYPRHEQPDFFSTQRHPRDWVIYPNFKPVDSPNLTPHYSNVILRPLHRPAGCYLYKTVKFLSQTWVFTPHRLGIHPREHYRTEHLIDIELSDNNSPTTQITSFLNCHTVSRPWIFFYFELRDSR